MKIKLTLKRLGETAFVLEREGTDFDTVAAAIGRDFNREFLRRFHWHLAEWQLMLHAGIAIGVALAQGSGKPSHTSLLGDQITTEITS